MHEESVINYKIGPAIRYLMQNQQKNTITNKRTLKLDMKIADINSFLELIDIKLNKFKMQLVGVLKDDVVSYKQADKIFITKKERNNFNLEGYRAIIEQKRHELEKLSAREINAIYNDRHPQIITTITIIYLEGGKCELSAMKDLILETNFFLDMKNVEAHINFLKTHGYISIIKEDDNYYAILGWFVKAAFPSFNPNEIFKDILNIQENTTYDTSELNDSQNL